MSKQSEIQERVLSTVKSDQVSPYRLSKLESVLRGKVIPPQKIYGYVRQGYIKSTKNELGKMQIDKKEQIRYLTKTMLNNQ